MTDKEYSATEQARLSVIEKAYEKVIWLFENHYDECFSADIKKAYYDQLANPETGCLKETIFAPLG